MIIIKYLRLKHNLRHPQAGGRRIFAGFSSIVCLASPLFERSEFQRSEG